MGHLLPIDRLKMKVSKVMEICDDDRPWNKWARRLIMGIDNSIETATKAHKKIVAAYDAKFPPPKETSSEKFEDEDSGYSKYPASLFSPSIYTNSSKPSSYDEEDVPTGPTEKQIRAKFKARIACCKAVMAWGESTMEKPESPAREKFLAEMEAEISSIDDALGEI